MKDVKKSLINTNERVQIPAINSVVFYQPDDGRKKAYPVIINEGQYYNDDRICNYWYWQRVSASGELICRVEHGYGNFTKADGYNVVRKVMILI